MAYKRGNQWYTDVRFEGERYRIKSPVNSKRGALEYERLIVSRRMNGRPATGALEDEDAPEEVEVPQERPETFAEWANQWHEVMVVANDAPSEIASKRRILDNHLLKHFGEMLLSDIGYPDVERYKALKVAVPLKAKTINNHLTVLRTCLSEAVKWGKLDVVPMIRQLKMPDAPFDFLEFDEAEQLLNAATGVERTMILLVLRAGLRRGELLALRQDRLDLRRNLIRVDAAVSESVLRDTTKGYKSRSIPMAADLKVALQSQRHLRGPFVFCEEDGQRLTTNQVKRIVPDACRRAGLREVNWHVLRHTFASHLVMRGATLKAVQELMGHRDIKTTMRYAHLAPGHLEQAVDLLVPVGHNTVTGRGRGRK
ncbi:MAG: site-specific integrase [Deltaproteobacteria bacterium]|nr:MAG: site-specific integrase [Deltaproteobacteria bacterium]